MSNSSYEHLDSTNVTRLSYPGPRPGASKSMVCLSSRLFLPIFLDAIAN
jgi:hypothetical protein